MTLATENDNSQLFGPAEFAGISFPNRIIRSATHEGLADERGRPTEALKKKYLRMAKGEVGAIITGYAGIQQNGKSSLYRMLMIDSDELIEAYRDLVDAVHEENTPIIIQIAHSGRQTRRAITGEQPVAPSALKDKQFPEEKPRELTEGEIEEIIDNFVKAIVRAKEAGFDGAQVHAAHGYLLAQFLSPYANRRKDRWGGSTENRFRIVAEIFRRAREKVGDYPILIKLNAFDARPKGMRIEEAVVIAQMLEEAGCSAIEVSCGVVEDGFFTMRGPKMPFEAIFQYNPQFKKIPKFARPLIRFFAPMTLPKAKPLYLYNLPAAEAIKKAVSIPVIAVGGIKSVGDIRSILDNQKADMVAMSRPFILEPNIVQKFRTGKQESSKCIACNYCAIVGEEKPLKCHYGKLK